MLPLSTIKSVIRRTPVLSSITIALLVIGLSSTSWALLGLAESDKTSNPHTQNTTKTSQRKQETQEAKKEEGKPAPLSTQPKPEPKPQSTTPPPTTPAPSYSPTCTNPVFQTSDTNGGWSTHGYYVHNNMWNDEYGFGPETLYACAHNNWYVTSSQVNHDGAVLTYPNVHKDYSRRTIASFTTLTSTFAATSPQVGIYNVAYDIWLNGIPNDEVMIWTDNFNQYPSGSRVASGVSLSGYKWDVYATGGNGYVAFLPSGGGRITSGTLDIKAMLDYLVAAGRHSPNATVDQICYGVEIVSTNGQPATWHFTDFSITNN